MALAIDRGVTMPAVSQTDADFAFVGADDTVAALAPTGDPLGPLADLPGPGDAPGCLGRSGFNAIWRPHHPRGTGSLPRAQLTEETIAFTPIKGAIPNRGLAMPDINMFGLTYMQQISDAELGGRPAHRARHLGGRTPDHRPREPRPSCGWPRSPTAP